MRTVLVAPPLRPGRHELDPEEAHHVRSVLRLAVGDRVRVADGAGLVGEGALAAVGKQAVTVICDTAAPVPEAAASLLTVAVAPPKGDRWCDLIRALSELGVGRVVPLDCDRGAREAGTGQRLQRIARESLKQSNRGRLLAMGDAMRPGDLRGHLVLCDPGGAPARPGPATATTLVVGPEGGFTDRERAALHAAGAVAVRLASGILRIETAAAAAAAVWAAAWEHPAP
jgi:16S rRNA (uracil1498-N3)-methyltransferase